MLKEYNDVLTVEDLMTVLRLGKNSVYNLLNKKTISALRVGRKWIIPKKSVILYLQSAQYHG